jgi:pyrroline-5-carboxylate reductase
MKMSFIGGGNMGEAMVAALLHNHIIPAENMMVSDASNSRREHLKQMHNIRTTDSNLEAVRWGDVVVLAIKPQVLPEITAELIGKLKTGQLVLSIIAGAKIDTLREGLKHKKIVRIMPNTPAQIGMSMSVWTATEEVTEQQKSTARNILTAMGKEIYVEKEQTLDMVTAVSGSGPAYFFLFVEALTDAAVSIGLPRDMAKIMVLQTMSGSGNLIEKSGTEPAELKERVTSKGGTTAAALKVFEDGQFRQLVTKAVEAAYNRARELGGEKV